PSHKNADESYEQNRRGIDKELVRECFGAQRDAWRSPRKEIGKRKPTEVRLREKRLLLQAGDDSLKDLREEVEQLPKLIVEWRSDIDCEAVGSPKQQSEHHSEAKAVRNAKPTGNGRGDAV